MKQALIVAVLMLFVGVNKMAAGEVGNQYSVGDFKNAQGEYFSGMALYALVDHYAPLEKDKPTKYAFIAAVAVTKEVIDSSHFNDEPAKLTDVVMTMLGAVTADLVLYEIDLNKKVHVDVAPMKLAVRW